MFLSAICMSKLEFLTLGKDFLLIRYMLQDLFAVCVIDFKTIIILILEGVYEEINKDQIKNYLVYTYF